MKIKGKLKKEPGFAIEMGSNLAIEFHSIIGSKIQFNVKAELG